MHRTADHRTWNVFRRLHDDALCCAVSADVPVPCFLMSGDWVFNFQVARGDPPVAGFSLPAAEFGAGLNGFHLFLAFAPLRGSPREPKAGFAHSHRQDRRAPFGAA